MCIYTHVRTPTHIQRSDRKPFTVQRVNGDEGKLPGEGWKGVVVEEEWNEGDDGWVLCVFLDTVEDGVSLG